MKSPLRRAVVALVAASLLAASCGSSSDTEAEPDDVAETDATDAGDTGAADTAAADTATADTGAGDTAAADTGASDTTAPASGGRIVIGAEQEPDCADWIGVCGGAIWGTYMMQGPTIPTVFDVRQVDGAWVPQISPLMASEPVAEIVDGQQVITYELNPEAVWSDGTPITSADFRYTALQIRDEDEIFDRTGYDRIVDVETPDPATAIVTLDSPYAGWRTLFSGSYGVLPAHLLEGQDRNALMADGYDFSGGPWKIAAWERGVSVTLVPNDAYWGPKPLVDEVVFLFLPDTTAAFQAFRSGQVDALYPTPQVDALSQIEDGLSGARSEIQPESGNLEALWINNEAFPFDSLAVRQAFAYSIDRSAIVARLFDALDLSEPAQSFLTPLVSNFATTDFDRYTLDLGQVDTLMSGDGWAKNGDGVWEKDGRPAEFSVMVFAGNTRRELTAQILQAQLAEAGFAMSIEAVTPADLFGDLAPSGNFQVALYTLIDVYPDPALSASFDSGNIPSEENGFSGINFARADIPGLNELLEQVDVEIDPAARIAASKQADALIAEYVPSLPLQVLPSVLLWSEKIEGPLSINAVEGPFWNLEAWSLASE
jgi:peptide/nickel transport system substrate-binding protein